MNCKIIPATLCHLLRRKVLGRKNILMIYLNSVGAETYRMKYLMYQVGQSLQCQTLKCGKKKNPLFR